MMPDMMTATDYTQFAQIMPKGLRGSMLKVIDWPTSWAILYDLSPAQISQDRERASADSAWNRRAGEENRLLIWKKLLRAYFVGQPDPMPESDFPRWRKPFWMTDADKLEIDNLIREAYANEGDSSMAEVADGEVSLSEEQTTDAPMEQTTSAEDEPTEQAQQDSANVRRLSQVEGIYQLYESYFQRVHNASEELYLEEIQRLSPNSIRDSAVTILALEKLGYSTESIKDMLATFANRSLAVVGLRGGNRGGYGAFLIVDLRGVRTSARAYQTSVSNLILQRMGGVSRDRVERQFRPQGSRPLQTFKFSGMRQRRVVGLQVVSLNDISGTPNDISLREGNNRVAQAKADAREVFSASRTQSPTESTTQTSPESYYLIGFQFFPEGQTYRQNGQFNISLNKYPDDGITFSYVFYFARENEQGTYDLFRSVFGALPSDSRIRNQSNSNDRLAQLKMAWNRSGRLASENSIELQEMPLLDKRKLRQAFGQQEDAGLTTRGIDFPVTRSQMRGTPVAFAQIGAPPLSMIVAMGARFRRLGTQEPDNDELVGGSTAQNEQENARIARTVASIKTKKIDRTFAYEIEGNMMGAPSSREYQRTLGSAIDKVLNERGLNATRDRYDLNGSGDNRFSTITVKSDGSVDGPRPFEIDTPVFIPPDIDIAKTNFDETVSQRKFNEMKWDTYPNMWQWVGVFSEAMLQAGVRIHKSSGLHIHISSGDYNTADFKRYLENYAGFEPLIDLMMPVNSRKGGRSYNSSIIQDGAVTTGYGRGGRTPNPDPSSWRRSGNTGRSKVRTQTGIGTIEFRHPMTNIEGDLIKHFIILAYSLVEVSKIKQFTSFKFSDLESFLPDATATFLYNRIEDLDQPDLPKSKQRAFFGDNPRGRGTQSQLERKNLE